MTLEDYLREKRALVDATLQLHLPPADTNPPVIHQAMRYAVLGGGKRIRPIVAIAAAEAVGANVEPLLMHLCALELIHTYSLVHDDLPPLDNDDLRRGRRTTHVVYGEAMGVLTGDALLTEAFSWLARPVAAIEPARQLRAIAEVATAVDSTGMIGGQVADIVAERRHRLVVDEPMRVSVRGDLVAAPGDLRHQFRMALSDPPEHEEGAADVELVEDVEQAVGVPADAAFHGVPGRARHDAVEHADVKIVLHVDAHGIDDLSHAPLPSTTVLTVDTMM